MLTAENEYFLIYYIRLAAHSVAPWTLPPGAAVTYHPHPPLTTALFTHTNFIRNNCNFLVTYARLSLARLQHILTFGFKFL